MTVETEISTPAQDVAEDTSVKVEPENTDTSATEPEASPAAGTETQQEELKEDTQQEKLYAGKYKSVEDLEKGYSEAQKSVRLAAEFEKKYNELLQQQEANARIIAQERLAHAQQRGFDTIEAQEISDKVRVAEFEYYAKNLDMLNPEDFQGVRSCLLEYYNTGQKAYLDEAKKYFPIDFIERVSNEKSRYENQLRQEFEAQRQSKAMEEESKLAEMLKADYADFLSDISTNEGKAQALKSFCDVGSINSKEDMQVFKDIYDKIATHEREQAIKEYEASKAIEETKNKSLIDSTANKFELNDTMPSAKDIANMTQKQFDEACEKWGLDWIK